MSRFDKENKFLVKPYWHRTLILTAAVYEMAPIRLLLAITSILWGLLFFVTGTEHTVLTSIAINPIWGTLFTAHGVGLLWRVLDEKYRFWSGFFINSFGCVLWSGATTAIILSHHSFIDCAPEIMFTFSSIWILSRTLLQRAQRIIG